MTKSITLELDENQFANIVMSLEDYMKRDNSIVQQMYVETLLNHLRTIKPTEPPSEPPEIKDLDAETIKQHLVQREAVGWKDWESTSYQSVIKALMLDLRDDVYDTQPIVPDWDNIDPQTFRDFLQDGEHTGWDGWEPHEVRMIKTFIEDAKRAMIDGRI